ncbi:hypothetical protein Hanom_Chr05g00431831 [Helianthus anomalus]
MAQGLITFVPTLPNQLSSCNKWAQTEKHICQTKNNLPHITRVRLSPTTLCVSLFLRYLQTIKTPKLI